MCVFQGLKSSTNEKAASAMLTDKMDKGLGGIATQVSPMGVFQMT